MTYNPETYDWGCALVPRLVYAAVAAGALLAAFGPGDAQATMLTVLNDDDSGPGSLRQAIAGAAAGDTVTFDPSLAGATITLTSGEMVIAKNLTIAGPDGGITISGNNSSRAFSVSAGVSATLRDMTLRGGFTSGYGGAVISSGNLTMQRMVLLDSIAFAGGGVYSDPGVLTITGSTVEGNLATNGGGVYSGGPLNLADSRISGNTATMPFGGGGITDCFGVGNLTRLTITGNHGVNGGGMLSDCGAVVTLSDSTIAGNTASNEGGGIWNQGEITIRATTFSGNSAPGSRGGGMYNLISKPQGIALPVTLVNSTFSGNSSPTAGAIFNDTGVMRLTNVTLTANAETGGAYASVGLGRRLNLESSIIANQASGGDCVGGRVFSGGHNIDSDGSCQLTQASDQPLTDPLLAVLSADPVGARETHAVLLGSPAIDHVPAGTNGCGTTVTTDGRGAARPLGNGCEIGAYETATLLPVGGSVVMVGGATVGGGGAWLWRAATLGVLGPLGVALARRRRV